MARNARKLALESNCINPGTQAAFVISAQNGGKAERVARIIAENFCGLRIQREFPEEWKSEPGNVWIKKGRVIFKDQSRELTVKIGHLEGLVLRGVADKRQCPVKPVNGEMVLEVGENMSEKQIESYAQRIVATWVIHGENWRDRSGQPRKMPYGSSANSEVSRGVFQLVDGGLRQPKITLGQLISLGAFRSSHVGSWHTKRCILMPALCGMPVTLHEFTKEGGDDICTFLGTRISPDSGIWGAYAGWDKSARQSDALGKWKDLALRSASPFAFHVHATRAMFPASQLCSDLFLRSLGREKLQSILELIVTHDPKRYYRLIDRRGVTHELNRVQDDYLVYTDGTRIGRKTAAAMVLQSFLEMQKIQDNCGYQLPVISRLVLDTHAYIALSVIASGKQSSYMLSGEKLHQYLTRGKDANAHRICNERLIWFLRGFFPFESAELHVFPPMASEYDLASQYDVVASLFDKASWQAKEVT